MRVCLRTIRHDRLSNRSCKVNARHSTRIAGERSDAVVVAECNSNACIPSVMACVLVRSVGCFAVVRAAKIKSCLRLVRNSFFFFFFLSLAFFFSLSLSPTTSSTFSWIFFCFFHFIFLVDRRRRCRIHWHCLGPAVPM